MLRFWNGLIKMKPEHLTKDMFLNEFDSDTRRTNWTNEIKNIFFIKLIFMINRNEYVI